jgi:hypothetical protein
MPRCRLVRFPFILARMKAGKNRISSHLPAGPPLSSRSHVGRPYCRYGPAGCQDGYQSPSTDPPALRSHPGLISGGNAAGEAAGAAGAGAHPRAGRRSLAPPSPSRLGRSGARNAATSSSVDGSRGAGCRAPTPLQSPQARRQPGHVSAPPASRAGPCVMTVLPAPSLASVRPPRRRPGPRYGRSRRRPRRAGRRAGGAIQHGARLRIAHVTAWAAIGGAPPCPPRPTRRSCICGDGRGR